MAKSKTDHKSAKRNYVATATDDATTDKDRLIAMRRTASQVLDSVKNFKAVLRVLLDKDEQSQLRLAALQSLQASTFRVVEFEPYRSDYISSLRSLIGDPDAEIRQRVLGFLAREKDGPTQKRLLAGLEKPEKALVPPEKALQLLSYDVHSDAYPVARKIVKMPPNGAARLEALRLLAADASSSSLFEKLLLDKSQPSEVRQMCAAALQGSKPKKFQDYARKLALDPDEDEDVRAQSLAGLTHLGDAASLSGDVELQKEAEKLKAHAPAKIKKVARGFLTKYGK